jgi:succinate dehydrogenase / fumarate reductase membrane anchor subunit
MTWRASAGIRAWILQRVSGAYIALCFIALGIALGLSPALTYDTWRGWFVHPAGNIAAALFFVAVALHAWVGVRDVIIDYVHAAVLRFVLLGVTLAALSASLLWALRVLWSLPIK